jgi:hypothetical protein
MMQGWDDKNDIHSLPNIPIFQHSNISLFQVGGIKPVLLKDT